MECNGCKNQRYCIKDDKYEHKIPMCCVCKNVSVEITDSPCKDCIGLVFTGICKFEYQRRK